MEIVVGLLLCFAEFIGYALLLTWDWIAYVVWGIGERTIEARAEERDRQRRHDALTGEGDTHPFLRPSYPPANDASALLRPNVQPSRNIPNELLRSAGTDAPNQYDP
jgi:hypothetical protein